MKWYSAFFVLLFSVLISSPSIADDDDEFCGVISNQAFTVSFEIDAPDNVHSSISLLGKTLYVSTTDRGNIKPFWSMVDDGAFIKVDEQTITDDFEVELSYEPVIVGTGKTGEVLYKYRFDNDDPWTIVTTLFDVDLSEFNNEKIAFFALDDDSTLAPPYSVEEVSCKQNKPLPPPQPPNNEQCDYFPSSAQSWEGNANNVLLSVLAPSSYSRLYNTTDNKIGFNNLIISDYNGSAYTPDNQKISSQCDGIECVLGGVAAAPYRKVFNVPSNLPLFTDYVPVSGDRITQSSYFSSTYGAPYYAFTVNQDVVVTFKSGEYWLDSLNVIMRGEIIIDGDVIFHIKDELSVGGKVTQTDNSSLMVFSYSDKGCPTPQNFPAGPPDIYWDVNDYQRVDIASNAVFEGHIYAQGPVQLSNDAKVIGAVTACQLKMNNNSEITGAVLKNCDSKKDIKLVITPSSGRGLACDGIEINFSLQDDSGNLVMGEGQQLNVTSQSDTRKPEYACWSESGSISTNECNKESYSSFSAEFTANQPAEITRYIHSRFLSDYRIEASLDSPKLTVPAGLYEFIGESISIYPKEGVDGDNYQQVAGREFPFEMHIRGKENGNVLKCHTVKDTETKTIDFSQVNLPASSSELLQIWSKGKWYTADQDIEIDFIKGVAGGDSSAPLKAVLHDAGIVDITANLTSRETLGNARFYFRPFTMAICDGTTELPSNTTELNGDYLASGSDFNGVIKAVNWISLLDSNNNGIPDSHNADLVCKRPYTESYLTHSGYAASASLSASVIYPASGDLGLFSADNVPFNHYYKNIMASNQHQTTLFNWNEVGSLQLGSFQNNYFNRSGFNIPPTLAQVGRFYPSYFRITKTEWTYPTEQGSQAGSYIYMDQNFTDVDFEVTAYSALDSETTNYVFFDDSLKASFSLVDEVGYTERLNITDVDLNASHWNSGAVWHVNNLNHAVRWSKKEVTAITSTRTTEADGPFNKVGNSNSIITELSLEIHGEDPVTFIKGSSIAEAELLAQPDVRYGRMVLDSVGSAVGRDVLVPLKVEYWNGNTFVLSDTDNASQFDSSKYCKKTVWPDPNKSSETQLEGKGTVSQGQNLTTLIANSNNSELREQIRFWLRLASNSPQTSESHISCESSPPLLEQQPWLQYNWRGLGDEDPSAIVTFGVYRGNDRIIFRGESNIIGTSN